MVAGSRKRREEKLSLGGLFSVLSRRSKEGTKVFSSFCLDKGWQFWKRESFFSLLFSSTVKKRKEIAQSLVFFFFRKKEFFRKKRGVL